MADDQKPEVPKEKHLDDFKGTVPQQRKAKSEFISKYGYAAYEELVRNSSVTVKR